MGATATYGLRYPEDGDRPRGDQQLEALAEDIEGAAKAANPDTGSQSNAPVLAGAGWETLIAEYRLIGKVCTLHLWFKRTGGVLTGSPNGGNITDELVATITDPALRPTMLWAFWFRASFTSGSGEISATTGEVTLADIHADSTIETYTDEKSSTVHINVVYPVP